MTPQLQQAIKLLQMSSLELASFVATEIENNPLLDRPDGEAPPLDLSVLIPAEKGSVGAAAGTEHIAAPAAAPSREEREDNRNAEEWGQESYAEERAQHTAANGYGDDFSALTNLAAGTSLRDHLLEQIHVDFSDTTERMVAASLVELLDEAGYLPENMDLARTQLGASPEMFESVVQKLQRLDPAGIFARSLKECLAIQLREKDRLDPAMQTLVENLDLLGKHEHAALMKLCGVDGEDLRDMIAEIRALTPKPALSFAGEVAPPVIPDVLLYALPGGGWQVELNGETLPRVLANEAYMAQIQGSANTARGKEDKAYIAERWQQANWLVKALHQRATTILKVASEIVRRQDSFFVHGVQFLKPLTLRDVAEAIEMHESTVSRVTQNKFIATPRGLFELKYFFTNALQTTGGVEGVSATAVRTRIKELIEAEKPEAILSDDRLAEMLHSEGISVARRTVAKYREALHLPSSAQRRREKRSILKS
jgi:RNA polymerase sigma-54 factor